jgi:hypothetical protein
MSTAEVRRRYKRELAAAQPLFDKLVLPPALDDQRCDQCGIGTGRVWKQPNGEHVRRCVKCDAALSRESTIDRN